MQAFFSYAWDAATHERNPTESIRRIAQPVISKYRRCSALFAADKKERHKAIEQKRRDRTKELLQQLQSLLVGSCPTPPLHPLPESCTSPFPESTCTRAQRIPALIQALVHTPQSPRRVAVAFQPGPPGHGFRKSAVRGWSESVARPFRPRPSSSLSSDSLAPPSALAARR